MLSGDELTEENILEKALIKDEGGHAHGVLTHHAAVPA